MFLWRKPCSWRLAICASAWASLALSSSKVVWAVEAMVVAAADMVDLTSASDLSSVVSLVSLISLVSLVSDEVE